MHRAGHSTPTTARHYQRATATRGRALAAIDVAAQRRSPPLGLSIPIVRKVGCEARTARRTSPHSGRGGRSQSRAPGVLGQLSPGLWETIRMTRLSSARERDFAGSQFYAERSTEGARDSSQHLDGDVGSSCLDPTECRLGDAHAGRKFGLG